MKQPIAQPTDTLRVNIWRMLLSLAGFGLGVVYLTMALAAQDPLWFMSGFVEKPVRMIVYRGGERAAYQPGDPGFTELAEAVRSSLAQGVARPSGIGLSVGSQEDAYTLYLTVEAFFDRPVKLHASFNTGQPNQMLFPITGRHADQPIVFLGQDGRYLSNAPVLKTVQPIREALRALGYDVEQ